MVRILHASHIEFVQGGRSVKLPLETIPQPERHTVIMAVRDMQREIDELQAKVNRMKHGAYLR